MSNWDGKATNESGEPLMTREQYANESYHDALSQQDAREYEMYDSPEAQFVPEVCPWYEFVYEAFNDAGVEDDYLQNQMVSQLQSMAKRNAELRKGLEYDTHYRALQEQYDYLRIEYEGTYSQLDELLKAQEEQE
tara:strand:+ start:972 stop:1376 length:405 start_codon:yes stop_codon:yes gene_type:complete